MIGMRKVLLCLLGLVAWVHAADDWIALFPDGAPLGVKSAAVKEEVRQRGEYADGGIRNVAVPAYKIMMPPPEKRTGAGVVIFPGGGYTALAMGHEGYDYAKWMVQRGLVAMIVKYRVSDNPAFALQFPLPLLDARCAIRTMRAHAKKWGVDPNKVGVMGSSAGGHLTAMTATLHKKSFKDEQWHMEYSCRPDFAILVYPVIGMNSPWMHKGSQVRLLGEAASEELKDLVSTHQQVDADTPPCFLIHAADDKVVSLRNSTEFTAACAEKGVAVVCHVYAHGGHGFGLKGKKDSVIWPKRLEEWLISRELTPLIDVP